MITFFLENRGTITREEAKRIHEEHMRVYEKYDGNIPYEVLNTMPMLWGQKDGVLLPVGYLLNELDEE